MDPPNKIPIVFRTKSSKSMTTVLQLQKLKNLIRQRKRQRLEFLRHSTGKSQPRQDQQCNQQRQYKIKLNDRTIWKPKQKISDLAIEMKEPRANNQVNRKRPNQKQQTFSRTKLRALSLNPQQLNKNLLMPYKTKNGEQKGQRQIQSREENQKSNLVQYPPNSFFYLRKSQQIHNFHSRCSETVKKQKIKLIISEYRENQKINQPMAIQKLIELPNLPKYLKLRA